MNSRFDLITVDVVEPRSMAATLVERGPLQIELDEDDGRWLVVASTVDTRRFGLQRSDRREVEARAGSLDDVIDGYITLRTPDPDRLATFVRAVLGAAGGGRIVRLDDRDVVRVADGHAGPSNIHLDLACDPVDFTAELERMLNLGATRIGPSRREHWGTTQIFASPGGHLFCLNAYA